MRRGTFRWTRALSYLSLLGVPADARALRAMDGQRRPARARRPRPIEAFIDEVSLGTVVVGAGMQAYACRFPPTWPRPRPPAQTR